MEQIMLLNLRKDYTGSSISSRWGNSFEENDEAENPCKLSILEMAQMTMMKAGGGSRTPQGKLLSD